MTNRLNTQTQGFTRFDQISLGLRDRERNFTMNQHEYKKHEINGE